MTKKIFKSIFTVSVAIAVICFLCVSFVLYAYFEGIVEGELKEEARLISNEVQEDEGFLDRVGYTDNRITLVAPDGTVLFDSAENAADMENHGSREEIVAAAENGESFVTRYSDTLSTKTIYYAVELDDGNILRISQEQSMVALLLRGVIGPFIVILIIAVIVSIVISKLLSRKIVDPINGMDLNDNDAEEPYPELSPLMDKIRAQSRHINMQLAEMQRQQKEFTAITENMSEGFLLIDKNMEILSYNTAIIDLLGDPGIENPHTAFELNRSEGFRTAIEKALSGEHNQQPLETKNRYYNIMANPVVEKADIVGAVVIIVDVTEKEQREKLRREFTSNVSHELKTPLTTIYGVSDMMAEGIVKPADVKSFGRNIKEESGRMISLIDDIIKLSRLDENSFPEEYSQVDLFDMSKDVIERLSRKAEEQGIKLYLDGEHAFVKGIPSLCNEIIYNLCENAIKYNKENGSVMITVSDLNEGATVTVEDTGIGIPFEYRERIFERFFRIDESHSSTVDGTGLGLSIVKHAVSYMGGTIEVESAEGIGTKMIVRFPRQK